MATKKPKKALLSFANDEELGEEIEEFTMKKSKLSNNDTTNSAVNTTKKIKKMKQAPNALSITQQEATVTSSYLSSTGQYDYANLESLRNAQKFSAPVILTEEETNSAANLAQTLTNTAANSNSASNSIYENSKEGNDDTNGLVKKKKLVHFSNEDATINGNDTAVRTAETYESIELSGDAAEQFMELTEQLNKNKNGNSDGNIFFDDGETSMEIVDELALHSAKLATKKMLRDQASNRIYTTAVKEEKKELVFAEEDEGQDWEEELIARGVLQGTLPRASKLETVTSSANISSKSSSTQKGANDDGVTIAEMIDTIRNALGRLQFNLDNAARRKEQLQSQIDESKNHQSELRVKVQVGVEKLNHIQNSKYYFASLVGFLREKDKLIQQSHKECMSILRQQKTEVLSRRKAEQDDMLQLLREMGIEMDYNGYKPSREITVDEEFYDREQRRRRRWKDVVAYLGSSYQMDMSSLLYPKITSVSNNNEENLWLPNFQVNDLISSTTNPLLHSQITTVLELYEYISSDNYFDPAQKKTIAHRLQDILEDVDPSMSSVAEIMTNLTEFRAKYPGNYRSGYICMSIPDLLKPLLLLDVSGDSFNVFYPNTVEKIIPADLSINTDSDKSQTTSNFCINEKPWHEPIREFSVSAIDSFKDEEKADEGGDEDGDAILLPALVNSTLMTWLEEVIAESLDCYSKYQCYHCREVILQLLDYDPTADQLSSIFSTIVRVFTVQIENVCLPSVKLDKQAKIGDAVATRTLAAMAGIPMPPAMPTVQRLYDGDSQPSNDSKDKSKPYESALRFLVRQMHLLLTYTENLAQFSEFLAPEMMASLSWKFLTVKGLPVLMSLLQDEITEHNFNLCLRMCKVSMVLIAGQCSESQLVFQFEKSYAVLSKSGIPLLPFQLLSNYFSSDTSNCFNPRARTGLGFASKTYKQEAEELFDVLEKVHNMLKK